MDRVISLFTSEREYEYRSLCIFYIKLGFKWAAEKTKEFFRKLAFPPSTRWKTRSQFGRIGVVSLLCQMGVIFTRDSISRILSCHNKSNVWFGSSNCQRESRFFCSSLPLLSFVFSSKTWNLRKVPLFWRNRKIVFDTSTELKDKSSFHTQKHILHSVWKLPKVF